MNECIEWVGATTHNGYGRVRVGKRVLRAHRFSWESANGPIPSGLQVLHRCDNRLCINPEHLFLGTNDDNVADKIAKGRQAAGERLSKKLTTEKVMEIRQRWPVARMTQRRFASEYGIAKTTLQKILCGQTWAGVESNQPHATGGQWPTE